MPVAVGKGGLDTLDDKGDVTKKWVHPNEIDLTQLKDIGKPIVLLVDADIVAYRCAATADGRKYSVPVNLPGITEKIFKYKKEAVAWCQKEGIDVKEISLCFEPEPEGNATANVNRLIKTIKGRFKCKYFGPKTGGSVEHYLTPESNFRNTVKSDYKANRKGVRKPHHLAACKAHLQEVYGAQKIEGYEADDLLCIRATELTAEGMTPICVTLDKDMDQIPGFHYNWVKKSLYFTTESESLKNLYLQLLMGDKVDNIPGIPGVGPVTAKKILADCDGSSELKLYITVVKAYVNKFPQGDEESDEDFYTRMIMMITQNMRLLYLCRSYGDLWEPPIS